jgi:hypothetical protein
VHKFYASTIDASPELLFRTLAALKEYAQAHPTALFPRSRWSTPMISRSKGDGLIESTIA